MGLTDVKGDRSLRPSQQVQHKDFYVRIVEERADGIVVSGAKTHISQAPACNEILIAPCRAMREDDKAYAVAFGIPVNATGVTMISAEPEVPEDYDLFDHPITGSVYINDALIVFENVFIPKERIFLKGEWEFAGDVAYMFANFHRLSAETYKAIELELFTGAAVLMAEYNGIEKVSHVREKLTWLAMYTELIEILGRAAVEHCIKEADSDLVYPNPMIANICKYEFANNWHDGDEVHPGHRRRHRSHGAFLEGLLQPGDAGPSWRSTSGARQACPRKTASAWSSSSGNSPPPTRTCSPSMPKARWRPRSSPSSSWPTSSATRQRRCGRRGSRTRRAIRSLRA